MGNGKSPLMMAVCGNENSFYDEKNPALNVPMNSLDT
jgi:hypothetical protein